jgi:ABC-type transport system involved in Fe-S cluster assembly fused permease/ATPase subunit
LWGADRIVVLVGGRIAEQGGYEWTMVLGGRDAELFELEAAACRSASVLAAG